MRKANPSGPIVFSINGPTEMRTEIKAQSTQIKALQQRVVRIEGRVARIKGLLEGLRPTLATVPAT